MVCDFEMTTIWKLALDMGPKLDWSLELKLLTLACGIELAGKGAGLVNLQGAGQVLLQGAG